MRRPNDPSSPTRRRLALATALLAFGVATPACDAEPAARDAAVADSAVDTADATDAEAGTDTAAPADTATSAPPDATTADDADATAAPDTDTAPPSDTAGADTGGPAPCDDADHDTVCDADDRCPGHDDLADADRDGVPNGCDACPALPGGDADGDGVCDLDDRCPGHPDQLDADLDGLPDDCDPCPGAATGDSDGDGVCDDVDACPGQDDTLDTDHDGTPNGCDTCPVDAADDSDGDGVCDGADRCPGHPDQADADGDELPDACDACPDDPTGDSDGDGVCNQSDRCPGHPDQADADHDGIPDACDPCPSSGDHTDRDGDGTPDACDACPDVPRVLLYDVNSDLHAARAALALLGCDHTVAGVADLVPLLDSGAYGALVLDMPDARPEGDWTRAVLDFVAGGGAAVLSTWRPDLLPAPDLAATFGALLGAEATSARAFTPTWRDPIFTAPFDLTTVPFPGDPASTATFHGPTLAPVAGRAFARFDDGAAIVASNGGRTFFDGFLWDDHPEDRDGDGKLDVAELVANQLVAASRARLTAGGPAAPAIDGVADTGETVRYDLPILRGVVAADTTEVSVRVGGAAPRVWPAADRRLKVLVPLEPGQNYVSIRDRGAVTYLALRYTPQTNPRKVRFVYALASDGDGSFDAPPGAPRDLATATRRVALGARLLQAMMADRLDALGYGRRTFRVDTDPATGAPAVTVWRTSATTAAWRAMSDAELFSWVWQHQGELPACGDCKTVVMLGMTHWDPAQNKALAHTALGGGGVALFGTGTLYSWADALDDVVARLSDDRTVASLGAPLFDDSGYRGTLWANYATGLGAVLHELGHALDLPHPTDDAALLNRGFDHVNRLVMVSEPASNVSAAIPAIWPSHEPFYVLANGARLRWHRWLALDAASYTVNAPPAFSRVGDEVRVDSPAGIRAVSYRILVSTGPTSTDWRVAGGEVQLGVPPARWVVNVASLRFLFQGQATLHLGAIDDQGNITDDFSVAL